MHDPVRATAITYRGELVVDGWNENVGRRLEERKEMLLQSLGKSSESGAAQRLVLKLLC
jgi:hypothetical protein